MPPARRFAAAPDLTQQDLVAELERKDEIIRKYAISETKNGEEIAGLHNALRAAGKEITNLKRKMTRQARESARAEQVDLVVAKWRELRPKASRAFGKPGSASFDVIDKALVLMAEDEAGPVEACCEAIVGLNMAPWEAFGKRYAKPGPNRTHRATIDYALGDEQKIERCRGIARMAQGDEADRMFGLWRALCDAEVALAAALFGEIGRRGSRDEPEDGSERFVVDGIVTRVDG